MDALIPPEDSGFTGGNFTPPGQYNLVPAVNAANAAIKKIDTVAKGISTKIRTHTTKAIGHVNSVLGVLGQSTANAAQSGQDMVADVLGNVKTQIAMNAAGAMERIGSAVGPLPVDDPNSPGNVMDPDCCDFTYLAMVLYHYGQADSATYATVVNQILANCPHLTGNDIGRMQEAAIGFMRDGTPENLNVASYGCTPHGQTTTGSGGGGGGTTGGDGGGGTTGGGGDGGGTGTGGGTNGTGGGGPGGTGTGGQGSGGGPSGGPVAPPITTQPPGSGGGGGGGGGGPYPIGPPTIIPPLPPVYPPEPPKPVPPGGTVYPPVDNKPGDTCKPQDYQPCPPAKGKDGKPQMWWGVCQTDGQTFATQDSNSKSSNADATFYGPFDSSEAAQYAADAGCQSQQIDKNQRQRKSQTAPSKPPPLYGLNPDCDVSRLTRAGFGTDAFDKAGIGSALADTDNSLRAIFDGLASADKSNPVAAAVTGAAKASLVGPWEQVQTVVPILTMLADCQGTDAVRPIQWLTLIGYWQKFLGVDITYLSQWIQYVINAQCRRQHIGIDGAMAAFLANQIDGTKLDQYCAIHGLCQEDVGLLRESQRAKLVPIELSILRRRNKITDQEYVDGLRQLGYIQQRQYEQVFQLSEQRPPVTELIRFMVRDADDQDIVSSLGLDDLFDSKYADKLKHWAADQGVTDEQMRYNWRSHWTIPGPDKLFEFWQRNRRNAKFGTPEEQRSKINKALIHNDILPTWFDSYFATQYTPLGMRQLRMLFATGDLDEKELDDGFAAVGYDDANAKRLTEWAKKAKIAAGERLPFIHQWIQFAISGEQLDAKLRDYKYSDDDIRQIKESAESGFEHCPQARAFVAGTLTGDSLRQQLATQGVSDAGVTGILDRLSYLVKDLPELVDYETGILTRDATVQALDSYGVQPVRSNQLLNKIDDSFERAKVRGCTSSIRKRYLLGDVDATTAADQLVKLGLVLERANHLVESWQCMLASKGKEASAATLCKWYAGGLITSDSLIHRVETLGYSHDDAVTMYAACQSGIDEKQRKAIAKERADAIRAAEKARAQGEKTDAALARQALQQYRASEASKKAKKNREAQMLTIANKLEKKCDCNYVEAIGHVQSVFEALKSHYALGIDEALVLMTKTVESWTGPDPQTWIERCFLNAELLAQQALPSTSSELVNSP